MMGWMFCRIAIQRQGLLKSAIDFLRLKKSWAESATLLQGATSAIHVDVDDDGSIQTQRLDLLVSPGSRNRGKTPLVGIMILLYI